ncbi:MAG: NAD(P)-binding domain-containing protein [Pseudomonadota bacterium]
MPIAIIATGNVGSAIARSLKGKGHALVMGARDPRAAEVVALASETGATAMTPEAAAAAGDVVILALPWGRPKARSGRSGRWRARPSSTA